LTVFQAIVLGLTQGITEFAPVSSSGHLILVPWLFGWSIVQDPALNKTFDVALHMGTLLGAVIYFHFGIGIKPALENARQWQLLGLFDISGAIAAHQSFVGFDDLEREHDIGEGRAPRHERRILERHADTTDRVKHPLVADIDFAAGCPHQTGDELHQR